MSQALIRPAKPEDAAPLSHLAHVTFQETFLEGFAIPYPPEDLKVFVDASYSLQGAAERPAAPVRPTWVAGQDGRLLAYANAGPCHLPRPDAHPEPGELYRIYVLREAQ